MAAPPICKLPLEGILTTKCFDITQYAIPCRYRLLSCAAFVKNKELEILEFTDFPTVKYTAVSYVWKGNIPNANFHDQTFNVPVPDEKDGSPGNPGDPIGVDVLNQVCVASMARGVHYLWLDRLCIMQMNDEDKKWQIRQMHAIYLHCEICIVVPGGIQCLVRLDEETQWIHRGWTLQEAVAPSNVLILFSWRFGSCKAYAGDAEGDIDEITAATSAVASLSFIVDSSTIGSIGVNFGDHRELVRVKLLSSHPSDQVYNREDHRIMSPNVGALARIMSKDLNDDERHHSIWQSALMRTSSRPVDMVFSIMGLFGITLDTSRFEKEDRAKATIELAREVMAKGGRATWLAAAFRIQPSRQISTFPLFPRTSVSGKSYVKVEGGVQEISLLMENEYPIAQALVPMPKGCMDEKGYLTFSSKAIPIRPRSMDPQRMSLDPRNPAYFQDVNDSWWETQEDSVRMEKKTFAVLIGYFVGYYPGGTPATDSKNVRAAIIEEHAQDRFHVRTYLALSKETKAWVKTWQEQTFIVGGPLPDDIEDAGQGLPVVNNPRIQRLNDTQGASCSITPSLKGIAYRRARWASPQLQFEDRHLYVARGN
ncbi:uncharacterized protein F4817DRAFT_154867 [Daldinia loculata]|uniref:uncharacterized protein n=1 Tax=Daldinia loculata TaxID=103429 RepID=UPI0020C1D888|nr:uncharacterized protein F4817DRAFT_154867 [Daldinia loculata]KAI1646009.1 hypothetical protein F4817DRAFT_154867 [Daldinia loculata]